MLSHWGALLQRGLVSLYSAFDKMGILAHLGIIPSGCAVQIYAAHVTIQMYLHPENGK